jgi:hypothetical protein
MSAFLTDCAWSIVSHHFFESPLRLLASTLYLGLAQNLSNKQGLVIEPAGAEYARIPLTSNPICFLAPDPGHTSNALPILFAKPLEDWGMIRSAFMADAITAGNILAMADLSTPRMITRRSSAPRIATGDLVFRLW